MMGTLRFAHHAIFSQFYFRTATEKLTQHRHCEPTGRREAPPDDKLREAIHGAAGKKEWIASLRSQ
jgi:hypothetical protein